ncbi:uncharacterized protein LOC132545989 [Ylistrum balloti]|uniref:uncharacterized protein LOC132545989 n=1 Tax=Ylistrum balloti TaxID=509963 RepID=UPI002905928A|nr:uncharacterized protein LOC132545989 [Ylistrum balloti]
MMSCNQAELLAKLVHMKKELARKEKKLKKCARAASAKEYVKRRLREQEVLEGKTDMLHVTSDTCLPQVSSDTCQTNKSPCQRSSHSTVLVGLTNPGYYTIKRHLVSTDNSDKDGNVEIVSVHTNKCLQPDKQISEESGKCFFDNRRQDDGVSAVSSSYSINSITEIPRKETDETLNWNSSSESMSSNEQQSKRSLSLKRRRNTSKCMVDTSILNKDHSVNLSQDPECVQKTQQNIGRKSTNTTDCSMFKDEKKDVALKQIEQINPLKQKHPVGKLKETKLGSEKSRVKSKCVKRRRRTIGRILDIELEKEIDISGSSQNSEEYETLRLIQQSYRSGVDYSTRHGKTHNLPSMLSSIFQYFIDENRRQKDWSYFSLPEDQFGRMMQKRLNPMTEVKFENTHQGNQRFEPPIAESGSNFMETPLDFFPMDSRVKSTNHLTELKIKNSFKAKELESSEDFLLSHHHDKSTPGVFLPYSYTGDVNGNKIEPITKESPLVPVSVDCPGLCPCDHANQEHSKDCLKTDLDHLCKKELSVNSDSSVFNNEVTLSRNCFKSLETPKRGTESYSEESITMSPALFTSPPNSLETKDSSSSRDCGSQDSQINNPYRVNKGERLKHLGCIQLSQNESLRCVAACCIQIIRRRTDVLLCIGQSTMSLWNQRGNTYICVNTWQLEQDYSSVECYTYPAVFRDNFCYFVVVLRGTECSVHVVHFNARKDKAELVQCLTGNSVTACCLNVEALAVGHTDHDTTKVVKYLVDSDGQLISQQEFDHCSDSLTTPKRLMLVENLPSALALWSSNNTLVLWNIETGTLVWTLELSMTWPEDSTLVSVQWQQEYFLLSLLNDKKSDDAGVLLVINPETEISKELVHYSAIMWEGVKCVGQLDDRIVATDYRGQTCVWDPYTGHLAYQCDPSTGIKGLGNYWRKLITMFTNCVHIFK